MRKPNGDSHSEQILPFAAADQRGGILLEYVEEVHRACAISRLPGASGIVEGIINIRGEIVPVIDLRARFGLAPRKLALNDRLIIVQCRSRRIALRVDEVDPPGVIEMGAVAGRTDKLSKALGVAGVVRLPDDLLLIYDADAFLSCSEKDALERALEERQT